MSILRLKEVLKEKGVSGKELAEMVGVSQPAISDISNGKSFPRPDLLLQIGEALDVDVRELFKKTRLRDFEQIKHEQLVHFVNAINSKSSFQFKVRKESITLHSISDTNEINSTIVCILNLMNVSSGSNGSFNLYRLLQGYLLDTEKRQLINDII